MQRFHFSHKATFSKGFWHGRTGHGWDLEYDIPFHVLVRNPFPKPDENVVLNSGPPHCFGRAKPRRFSTPARTNKIVFKPENLELSHLD